MVLRYILGPLIGAGIGYCTNYIAVKMLFRPRREIRLFGHRLPFTPGVIPKGKPRLARAVGRAVSGSLLTQEDITRRLTEESLENAVVDEVMGILGRELGQLERTVTGSEEQTEQLNARISDFVSAELMRAIEKMELHEVVTREGGRIIKEKTEGTMLAMFVSDALLDSMLPPVGREIEQYILENGPQYLNNAAARKLDELGERSPIALLEQAQVERESVERGVRSAYRRIVEAGAAKAVARMDLAGMIEEKINAMEVEELEKLIFSVMKKELSAIVNLGALIGLILGLLNLFL